LSDIVPTPPEPRPLPFRRPADYYSAPVSEVRPIFPRAVPYGCGAASIVAILILFGAGAVAGSGKGGAIFATLFGTMAGEIRGMWTKDVTAAQKEAFNAEMKALQKNLDEGKISVDNLQPLLRAIRDTSGDSSVDGAETETLTKAARGANAVARSHPAETARPRDPATPR
jgi:hypothetical protein